MSEIDTTIPDFGKDIPTLPKNVPTEGMFDHRWGNFEDTYNEYIRRCIEEIDPRWVASKHDIMNRIEKFLIEVLPKYVYKPENERFRIFLRRLVHATVHYLKTKAQGMKDWQAEFRKVNRTADKDFEDAVADLAEEAVLNDPRWTAEEQPIVRAMLVEKASLEKLQGTYGTAPVRECSARLREMIEIMETAFHGFDDRLAG